jgi:hypothetical protein
MTTSDTGLLRLEEPLAELERQLMRAYAAGAGHELSALLARDDEEARQLLAEASRYASVKLSEVEARSHFVRALHGEA